MVEWNKCWNNLLGRLDKGSSPFWNLSKVLRKKSNKIPILKQNGCRFTTNQEKCDLLAQSFSSNHSISSTIEDLQITSEVRSCLERFDSVSINTMSQVSTDTSKISFIIKNLKSKKAPGIDGINNRCLKALPMKGIKYLTVFINSCLKFGYFPQDFKASKVIPIKKPNKPNDCPSP